MNSNTEKVAYGSNLTVLSFNGSGKIPILYGGHILITEIYEELLSESNFNLITEEEITSINIIVENSDSTAQMTYTFPLETGQILRGNDYIDSEGLHIDGNTIAFTSQQETAYAALQNIPLYEGISHIIVTDASPAVLKLTYSSIEEDNQIYVFNKNEQLLAIFNKDDDDTLINPRIEKKQNSESKFTFTIDIKNPKWEELKNPENLYLVDGMFFSTSFDGSFKENITENDEKTMEVTAYERQQLLSRKYVRAWNSETNLERIDTFMVVILSNGNLPLKNNGTQITTRYPKGSSGYVLEALLYGTGWTVGICDIYEYENGQLVKDENDNPVYAKFDFETDQMNIYDNILKVQELWGGILIFDSMNKIVHHRDETIYLPYNGYEVKYQKNMQSLEKEYNNKIITKLCPLGENGLNISSINSNSVWLENHSYTNSVLEGIENNPDITDPIQLKRWGERKLEMLCRPSIELDVNIALLYQLEGYELETIDLNDIVRVVGYQKVLPTLFVSESTIIGENSIIGGVSFEQLRVVEFTYSVWNKSDAKIKLSNITLDSTDVFRKAIIATNDVNAGALVGYNKIITSINNASEKNTIDPIKLKNIYIPNTTKFAINDYGVLTNLKFNGTVSHTQGFYSKPVGNFDSLGFECLEADVGENQTTYMEIHPFIPNNFVIVSAQLFVEHYPIKVWYDGNTYWGYARNLRLYQGNKTSMYENYSAFEGIFRREKNPTEIQNAFGTNGFNPSEPNDNSQILESVLSFELKDYILNDKYFVVKSGNQPPTYIGDEDYTDFYNCAIRTGMVSATLNIIGYLKI